MPRAIASSAIPSRRAAGDRAEHVLDVEAPAQARLELEPAAVKRAPRGPSSRSSGRSSASSAKPKVSSALVARELLGEPTPVRVVDVDRRGRRVSAKSRRFASK